MKVKRVNIGELILQVMTERGMSKGQFADAIGRKRQNVNKTVFDKRSIDTELLCVISEVLDYNFFEYYCDNVSYSPAELRATLIIEMGTERSDKSFTISLGENKIQILDK